MRYVWCLKFLESRAEAFLHMKASFNYSLKKNGGDTMHELQRNINIMEVIGSGFAPRWRWMWMCDCVNLGHRLVWQYHKASQG